MWFVFIFRNIFQTINYGSKKCEDLPDTVAEKRMNKEIKKAENKAAKTLLAIMLAFIITWLPYDGELKD